MCAVHGVGTIEAQAKEHFRGLAMRGGPYTEDERRKLLKYCWTDVDVLAELFHRTAPKLNRLEAWLERSYFRGAVVQEYTRISARGIPIDPEMWAKLKKYWHPLVNALTETVAQEWPVFEWKKKESRYGVKYHLWLNVMQCHAAAWHPLAHHTQNRQALPRFRHHQNDGPGLPGTPTTAGGDDNTRTIPPGCRPGNRYRQPEPRRAPTIHQQHRQVPTVK